MSIRPLSQNEIESLENLFKKYKWDSNGIIENYYRFSINKNNFIVLTLKFPVVLPVKLNIPFEIACFRISVVFQFWNLNDNTLKLIIYLLESLGKLASQISIEHNFPIEEKKNQFLKLLNNIMPDLITNENERAWLNRIRISLMNKRELFKEFDNILIKNIVNALKNLGLEGSFKIPWELKKGLPKIRTSETLFFSNDEPFDEFFIAEKGYYTYFKDLEYEKFYIRSFFETYTPYILYGLFGNNPDFKYEDYIENWIKFSRLILNSIIEIIDKSPINSLDLIKFNPERELSTEFFDGTNNFAFSALHYEAEIAKELFSVHNDLFNKPPEDFEVIEYINSYTEAEELINNYRFNDASKILTEALKIFNKHKQKKVVVSILLLLRKIASILNQDQIAINYLQSALGVAKSGEIPIEYIIKIHYLLGKTFFKLGNLTNALQHFQIMINFLENEVNFPKSQEYLGLAYLYSGLIEAENGKISESRNYFKQAIHIGEKSLRVKLYYYLKRANQLKNKGNLSQAYKMLKNTIDIIKEEISDDKIKRIAADIYMELAEFFIHHRKEVKRASMFLKVSRNLIDVKTIIGIKQAVKWNLLMSDFYNFILKNRTKSNEYIRRAQKLKGRLKEIGVII
ncbi:MAG: tetratricopeptide repeat protein [Promethearchaeota archaeon]